MKKYIVVLILLILIITQLSTLSITPTSWDLGSITNDSNIQTLELEIFNNTTEKIIIDFISTCDCLISDTDTINLSTNESAFVTFQFDPIDENGTVSKFMIIRTTQPGLPKALFEVYGEVAGIEETVQNNSETDSNNVQSGVELPSNRNKNINLKYYYSAGCESCRYFLENTIPALEKKLGIDIKIESLDIMEIEVYEYYFSLLTPEEVKNTAFPAFSYFKFNSGWKKTKRDTNYRNLFYNFCLYNLLSCRPWSFPGAAKCICFPGNCRYYKMDTNFPFTAYCFIKPLRFYKNKKG
ncbi:MAG: DUF1573 domain-containing protein [Spirochaetota bacterium]|nr:DUF1573 domain-containing protein [Spirochaetota bacterium]